MHEKSSKWKNQKLNHSDVNIIENEVKVCLKKKSSEISAKLVIIALKLVIFYLKLDLFQKVHYKVQVNGGKKRTAYLYKKTLEIRDMFRSSINVSLLKCYFKRLVNRVIVVVVVVITVVVVVVVAAVVVRVVSIVAIVRVSNKTTKATVVLGSTSYPDLEINLFISTHFSRFRALIQMCFVFNSLMLCHISNSNDVNDSLIFFSTSVCLSAPSIIMTVYLDTIWYSLVWYLSGSVYSKKPEPEPFKGLGRTNTPLRGKKYTLLFFIIPNPNSPMIIELMSKLSSFRVHLISKNYDKTNKKSCRIFIEGQSLSNYFLDKRVTTDTSQWTGKRILILSGDVESNPGPGITLISQNTRGLKRDSKLRQLINKIYKSHNITNNLIVALQETHLETANLKYLWRGNNIFTPGNGHQGGCITLLSENIEIIDQVNIGNEAHIAKVNIVDSTKSDLAIIINLHAPCAHNQHKIDFFRQIREKIDFFQENEVDDLKIIMLGDFNCVNRKNERINTAFSKAEQRISAEINDIFNDLMLTNCWEYRHTDMTWRHGDKMSRIDRIYWSQNIVHDKRSTVTDWTYTESDHAAVVVNLSNNGKIGLKPKVTRLDTRFMQSTKLKHEFLKGIKERCEQLNDTGMNPHQRLEFLKMSIRSLALEIAANEKKHVEEEMKNLKKEIDFWQKAYENDTSGQFTSIAVTNLNELMSRRDKILNDRGEYLSQRIKTKWYQEGEKSTKYFLNLQRAKSRKTEMSELIIDGQSITDNEKIKENVESFYKKLYEKGDSRLVNEGKIENFLTYIERLDQNEINILDKKITEIDVLETLKNCSDSAPGPDGIPYSIIKLTWHYFGKLLIDLWEYALITGSLTHSHRSSYLRLIPKEGKDPRNLKNWRPITLSNCDFKLISKTLAKKLTSVVKDQIGPTQTAYIQGRQITDNLHLMLHTIENSTKNNMVVSLDAEKAFDSVEHWFIKAILKKLGLEHFINLFNLMYKDQMVDIILNNDKAGSYSIRNGVKQGDALSCILFIMCMEPLIKNILNDESIKPITSEIPKVVAYADDISCLVMPEKESLNGVFKQYERLTEVSGLKLNADKTEIIAKGGTSVFEVRYLDQTYKLYPKESIKINGLIMGYDIESCRVRNIDKVYNAMESQLKQWSNRGLTLIGKIQIYKTFGLSQILYIGSVHMINKKEEKKFDELIYRFIWNNDMRKNKAPDRLKREILKKPVMDLGFGMLDFREIIKSIRIKTILRLLNNEHHPLTIILKNSLNNSWVKIKVIGDSRECLSEAIKEIGKVWNHTMGNCESDMSIEIYKLILLEYVGDLIEKRFENKRLGLQHRHDSVSEIINISKSHPVLNKLDKNIKKILTTQLGDPPTRNNDAKKYSLIPFGNKLVPTTRVSSKMIRKYFFVKSVAIRAKLLPGVDIEQLRTLGKKLKSLTNIRLKTIILRSIHGDIYCGTRLKKFGMSDTDQCIRCNQSENIDHQLFSCNYTRELWKLVERITGIKNESLAVVLGCSEIHNKTTLTIHSELIRILLSIDRPLTPPKDLLNQTIARLINLEKGVTKYQIEQMQKILTY